MRRERRYGMMSAVSPDEPAEVIGNLPRSRPSRSNPRRDAARAKAATAHAADADGAAPPVPAVKATAAPAAKKSAPKPKPRTAPKAKAAPRKAATAKPKAARPQAKATPDAPVKPPIPPAGYAVPGATRSGDPADVIAETLRAAGQLVQGGADALRGFLGRR